MINKFINLFGTLSDSIVTEVSFNKKINTSEENNSVKLKIYGYQNHSDYVHVTIEFTEIVSMKFSCDERFNNFAPSDVLIRHDGMVFFDFDPIDYIDHLEENPNSAFKILSKGFDFYISTGE